MKIAASQLNVGDGYSKVELAELFDEPKIAKVREGWFQNDAQDFIPFFVTLNKEKADPSVAYNDYFEDGLFFWESQSRNTLDSKWIKKFSAGEVTPLLFVREAAKVKSKTQKYVYAGKLVDPLVDETSSKPVKFTFRPIDLHDDVPERLKSLVEWNPGQERRGELNAEFAAKVKPKRKRKAKKPDATSGPDEVGGSYQPGPTPGEREYSVSAKDHEDWYVYVLALSNDKAVKVGFSHNPKSRLKEYNHGILPEITGLSWRLAFTHRVPNAEAAKRIEQDVLNERAESQLQSNGEVLQDVDITDLQLDIIGRAEASQ